MEIVKKFAVLLFFTFVSLSYATPQINWVMHYPERVKINTTITIITNVTDVDNDIRNVTLNIISPVKETIEMVKVQNDVYEVNYTPTLAKNYIYYISAIDYANNTNTSDNYTFSCVETIEIPVSVKIAAMCCGAYSFIYAPDKVSHNQTIILLAIFENCGNVYEEANASIWITGPNGSIVKQPSFTELGRLPPFGEATFYDIWYTDQRPFGKYKAWFKTHFLAEENLGYNLSYSWDELNQTANCTKIGENLYRCEKLIGTFTSYVPESEYSVSTVNVSNASIENQKENTTAKFGVLDTIEQKYYIYTFVLENCSDYCYACFGNKSSVNQNLCAYSLEYSGIKEKSLINYSESEVFLINSITNNGTEVNLSKVIKLVTIKKTVSTCYVNDSNAICNVTLYCEGDLIAVREFEITKLVPEKVYGKSKIVLIRENPPSIFQNLSCNETNLDGCSGFESRLIIYNEGGREAKNITIFDEVRIENLNATPLAFSCEDGTVFKCVECKYKFEIENLEYRTVNNTLFINASLSSYENLKNLSAQVLVNDSWIYCGSFQNNSKFLFSCENSTIFRFKFTDKFKHSYYSKVYFTNLTPNLSVNITLVDRTVEIKPLDISFTENATFDVILTVFTENGTERYNLTRYTLNNETFYYSLSPGEYSFLLKLINSTGVYYSKIFYFYNDCFISDNIRFMIYSQLPLAPNSYDIIRYRLTPPVNKQVYNTTSYIFVANGTHEGMSIEESDPFYNPEESKIIALNDTFPFYYTVELSENVLSQERTFPTNKTVRFYVKFYSLSGRGKTNTSFIITIKVPFTISNCSIENAKNYSCYIDGQKNLLKINGSYIKPHGEYFTVSFSGYTLNESVYLLPINKTVNGITESYLPGMFLKSLRIFEKYLPQPYPVTQPQPQPRPTPREIPKEKPVEKLAEGVIKIVLRPLNQTVYGYQEEWTPVMFEIENVGSTPVTNITILPILPEGWEVKEALVSFLNVSEKVNRTVFIKPSYLISPAKYAVPTKALYKNKTLDITYFWFIVLPGRNLTRIEIVESPLIIGLDSNKNFSIPVLIKNAGIKPLTGIFLRLENVEQCIEWQSSSTGTLENGEVKNFYIFVKTKTGPAKCSATLIVGSNEKAYAFAPMKIDVLPPPLLFISLPFSAMIGIVSMIILFIELHRMKKGAEVKLGIVLPFLVLIALAIYFVLWYLKIVPLV